jgi:hypothetical protein
VSECLLGGVCIETVELHSRFSSEHHAFNSKHAWKRHRTSVQCSADTDASRPPVSLWTGRDMHVCTWLQRRPPHNQTPSSFKSICMQAQFLFTVSVYSLRPPNDSHGREHQVVLRGWLGLAMCEKGKNKHNAVFDMTLLYLLVGLHQSFRAKTVENS